MTYPEVVKEIGKRLNDPDLKKNRALIGNMFVESLTNLMMDEKLHPSQLGEYRTKVLMMLIAREWRNFRQRISIPIFTDGSITQTKSTILKVFNVETDVYSTIDSFRSHVSFKQISNSHIERMRLEDSFKPAGIEIFYRFTSDRPSDDITLPSEYLLEFFLSEEWDMSNNALDIPVKVVYLRSPILSDFTQYVGDINAKYRLSHALIYNAITATVLSIKGLGMSQSLAETVKGATA